MATSGGVRGIGYFVFEASDPSAWNTFLSGGLGLTHAGKTAGGADAYRLDDWAGRVFVVEGPIDDLVALGLEADDAAAVSSIAERARAAGSPASQASPDEAADRRVEGLIRTREPGGLVLEVFHGAARATEPLDRTRNERGFVTGSLGAGHVALRADDVARTRSFFEQVLGFRLSDYIRCELRGGFEVDITFLHVNPRHHSIALGGGMPKHLHHFMVEVASLDDLGRAYDRCFDAGIRVTQTLGRHPNDRMLSFYARTPSGFEVECGYGGLEIDDATWSPTTHDRISLWGHRPPGSNKNLHVSTQRNER